MNEYPKWKYTAGDAKIVQDAAEEGALEGSWYDSPADIPAPKPAKGAKAVADQQAGA